MHSVVSLMWYRAGRGGRGEGAAGGRVGVVEKDLDMEEINWMMGSGMYIVIGANVRPYWQKSNKDVHYTCNVHPY